METAEFVRHFVQRHPSYASHAPAIEAEVCAYVRNHPVMVDELEMNEAEPGVLTLGNAGTAESLAEGEEPQVVPLWLHTFRVF